MRTVTTNNITLDQAIMKQDLDNMIAKSVAAHTTNLTASLLFEESSFSTKKPIVTRRGVNKEITRKRTVVYSDGYWAKIEIKDNDTVYYKVFNSGWLAKTFNKIGFRKVLSNVGWDSVKQRDTVEATLGATYMAIDETIAEDVQKVKHGTFLKEIIKTDPDNLKAIAQLDMLDKGDGPGTEQKATNPNASGQVSSAGLIPTTVGQNIAVSGSGTFSKLDSTKPASISSGPIAYSGAGGPVPFSGVGATSLSFGNDEEAIKVDPDGSITFGDKMAKAIEATVKNTTEKGELNGS